jgi:hypothetical protein
VVLSNTYVPELFVVVEKAELQPEVQLTVAPEIAARVALSVTLPVTLVAFPSVNDVVATDPLAPVAVTL